MVSPSMEEASLPFYRSISCSIPSIASRCINSALCWMSCSKRWNAYPVPRIVPHHRRILLGVGRQAVTDFPGSAAFACTYRASSRLRSSFVRVVVHTFAYRSPSLTPCGMASQRSRVGNMDQDPVGVPQFWLRRPVQLELRQQVHHAEQVHLHLVPMRRDIERWKPSSRRNMSVVSRLHQCRAEHLLRHLRDSHTSTKPAGRRWSMSA